MHENREVRFEKNDVQIGGIVAFGAGLIVLGVFVFGASAWLFTAFRASASRNDPPLSVLAAKERLAFPRDLRGIQPPLLQQNESTDLRRMRAAEDRHLNSYGWVDTKAELVHLPIAEAMRLLADPKIAQAHGIRIDVANKKGDR